MLIFASSLLDKMIKPFTAKIECIQSRLFSRPFCHFWHSLILLQSCLIWWITIAASLISSWLICFLRWCLSSHYSRHSWTTSWSSWSAFIPISLRCFASIYSSPWHCSCPSSCRLVHRRLTSHRWFWYFTHWRFRCGQGIAYHSRWWLVKHSTCNLSRPQRRFSLFISAIRSIVFCGLQIFLESSTEIRKVSWTTTALVQHADLL